MASQASQDTPRVYIACLASYNAGRLHGEWSDATDEDEIAECAARVIRTSPTPGAEETAIHDHEYFGDTIGEYSPIETIAAWGTLISEHGAELVAGLHAHGYRDPDLVREALDDRRVGVHESWADYAAALIDDCGYLENVPNIVQNHINYESMGRDFEQGGDMFAVRVGSNLHFFQA